MSSEWRDHFCECLIDAPGITIEGTFWKVMDVAAPRKNSNEKKSATTVPDAINFLKVAYDRGYKELIDKFCDNLKIRTLF